MLRHTCRFLSGSASTPNSIDCKLNSLAQSGVQKKCEDSVKFKTQGRPVISNTAQINYFLFSAHYQRACELIKSAKQSYIRTFSEGPAAHKNTVRDTDLA